MSGRHGNPGWSSGRPPAVPADTPSSFETRASELGLTAPAYVDSQELHQWCHANRNKCYIPEWLLKAWGITVNADAP